MEIEKPVELEKHLCIGGPLAGERRAALAVGCTIEHGGTVYVFSEFEGFFFWRPTEMTRYEVAITLFATYEKWQAAVAMAKRK
jgi:hypothetical protein